MLRILAISLIALVIGYGIGLLAGLLIIGAVSSNTHDRSVEAAMTAAFVTGPLVAVLAFLGTFAYLFMRGRG
jgi:hypothetical protein